MNNSSSVGEPENTQLETAVGKRNEDETKELETVGVGELETAVVKKRKTRRGARGKGGKGKKNHTADALQNQEETDGAHNALNPGRDKWSPSGNHKGNRNHTATTAQLRNEGELQRAYYAHNAGRGRWRPSGNLWEQSRREEWGMRGPHARRPWPGPGPGYWSGHVSGSDYWTRRSEHAAYHGAWSGGERRMYGGIRNQREFHNQSGGQYHTAYGSHSTYRMQGEE